MAIKIALPKGRILRKTAALLQKAAWELDEYHSKISFYHPRSKRFPDLVIKVLHEKDIPVQVSIGNYDLGICCLDWVEELLAKYPGSDIVKVKDLGYDRGRLCVAAASRTPSPAELLEKNSPLRIASEYPNLAESFALKNRFPRFSIFPVWGSAEAYPPENADAALLAVKAEADITRQGLVLVSEVLEFSACLIANRRSWESKNLNGVVTSLCDALPDAEKRESVRDVTPSSVSAGSRTVELSADTVRIALPDGHQQQPTLDLLNSTNP